MDPSILHIDLLKELTKYYTPAVFANIEPILMGQDIITMSLINFTVTNYVKEYESQIEKVNKNGDIIYINITRSYNEKLKEFKKTSFDSFCRKPKIFFQYDKDDDDKVVCTSIAQLNYFKWVLDINLLDFIRDNYDHIYAEYKLRSSSKKSSEISSANSESSASIKYKNKFKTTKKIVHSILEDDC